MRPREGASVCANCGHDNSPYVDFYRHCSTIENMILESSRAIISIRSAKMSPEAHGWLPDILALISASLLGLLAHPSHEIVKGWILARRDEFGRTYGQVFEFQRAVEAVFNFMMENAERVKDFTFTDEQVSLQFVSQLSTLGDLIATQVSPDTSTAGDNWNGGSAPPGKNDQE